MQGTPAEVVQEGNLPGTWLQVKLDYLASMTLRRGSNLSVTMMLSVCFQFGEAPLAKCLLSVPGIVVGCTVLH